MRHRHPAWLFVLIFLGVFVLHLRLLNLPYFWDEAGYYIPAARDLLSSGTLIPYSTPSNAHPPLVMAYLALFWRAAGFTPVVTRSAMLLVAAFALFGVFRLAARVSNRHVALAATICTALYPVFFAQSSLAQVDLAAAAFTLWGLSEYVVQRRGLAAIWFSLAVLSKETAILAPVALLAWELLWNREDSFAARVRRAWTLAIPAIPLGLWYLYHYRKTGFVFGNPEFFRYNVQATVQPLRVVLAFGIRLWQVIGYLNLYVLTIAAGLAMWVAPLRDGKDERPRIAVNVQLAFLAVIVVYALAMAVVGGAVLARYMLPAVPLVIIVAVSTLWRRVRRWWAVVTIVALAFIVGLFINPPYGFSFEDNLAYREYIELHQGAERFVEARYPVSRVLTAWPASDELSRPFLGYVTRPVQVFRIEDFSVEQLISAAEVRNNFDVALIFSTKYEPRHPLLEHWRLWEEWKTRFFGYHRDVPPAAAAQILNGSIVYSETRNGQWIAVIEMNQIYDAHDRNVTPPSDDTSRSLPPATPRAPAAVAANRALPE